jgi:uncharacterized protein YndB with AHSA1/START domain
MPPMTRSGSATVTLPADDQILITREFDAPPELVYKAWTTPDLVMRWWAGHHGEMVSADIDLRVGGSWRYVMRTGGGGEIAFHGEFRELVPGERIVTTEVFEGVPEPDELVLNVVTFAPSGSGGTALELLVLAHTKEIRDAIAGSGMEAGMQEQYDLLDELAASLAP